MARANQLGLGEILRTVFGWLPLPRQAHVVTYPDNIPLRGSVEPLEEGMRRYSLNTSISRRPAEKAPYHINCADLDRFIGIIYPRYVRGAHGQNIQVEFHPDEPPDTQPNIFSTYEEFMRYTKKEDLGGIIDEPTVCIQYSGANQDVPRKISLKRQPLYRLKTNYSVIVEASEAYNLTIIDACISALFNYRNTLPPPGGHRKKTSLLK